MTRPFAAFDPSQRHVLIASALLVLGIVFGGGGSPGPATELVVELLAGAAALAWLWQKGILRLPVDPMAWLLAALVLLLPLLQLVPLPPSIWHALPGREPQVAALALVDAADSWRPLSTSPARTLASLLSLIPPVMLLLMTAALAPSERRWLVIAAAAMAVVSALLGAMQLSAGVEGLRLYAQSPEGVVLGFQANRNATVDVLLIGLAALAAFAASRERPGGGRAPADRRGWWLIGAGALLVLASVLTASRAGIVLIVPTLIACWAILSLDRQKAWNRSLPAIAGGACAIVLGGLFLLRNNTALQKVAGRFGLGGGGREELWTDTVYAIGQYWPFGSGMGTFVPSFIALEPLEAVDASVPNRAHNDYLELALEAGAWGVAALALAGAIVLFMAVRAWRRGGEGRPQVAFGIAALAIVAAHSLVDYPLRSIALACLAAVAAGMLAAPPAIRRPPEG